MILMEHLISWKQSQKRHKWTWNFNQFGGSIKMGDSTGKGNHPPVTQVLLPYFCFVDYISFSSVFLSLLLVYTFAKWIHFRNSFSFRVIFILAFTADKKIYFFICRILLRTYKIHIIFILYVREAWKVGFMSSMQEDNFGYETKNSNV